MKTKILRKENAITLVALIITIIVLLILAMVSIRLVMNGGIIDRAERGTKAYSDSEIQEQLKLAYSEYQMGQFTGGITSQDVQDRLEQTFGEGNVSNVSIANGELKATIKVNGVDRNFSYNGGTGEAREIVPAALRTITKDNYGDYIDLGQSIVGTSATTDDWRILYNDKKGYVYAILADYLPNTNAEVTASGLHKVDNSTYNVNSTKSSRNLLDALNKEKAWKTLISTQLQNQGVKVKGATTAEILMASYNEKYGTNLDYRSLRTKLNDSSGSIDTLYMPHPGSRHYNNCYGYWLASLDTDNVWLVYYNASVTEHEYKQTCFGVCPVVSLPSYIQVTKNGDIWTVVQ